MRNNLKEYQAIANSEFNLIQSKRSSFKTGTILNFQNRLIQFQNLRKQLEIKLKEYGNEFILSNKSNQDEIEKIKNINICLINKFQKEFFSK